MSARLTFSECQMKLELLPYKNLNKVEEKNVMSKKELTGFVSVDRPQEKYYRKTPISNIDVNQTVYELIFNSNRENLDDYAIEYLGKSWTFKELKKETDKAADSFFKLGIRQGDVILVGISNSPEAIIILLSLNKIGAITKWFDIRASENDIKEYANTSNCKCLIILDFLISKVQLILKKYKSSKCS